MILKYFQFWHKADLNCKSIKISVTTAIFKQNWWAFTAFFPDGLFLGIPGGYNLHLATDAVLVLLNLELSYCKHY